MSTTIAGFNYSSDKNNKIKFYTVYIIIAIFTSLSTLIFFSLDYLGINYLNFFIFAPFILDPNIYPAKIIFYALLVIYAIFRAVTLIVIFWFTIEGELNKKFNSKSFCKYLLYYPIIPILVEISLPAIVIGISTVGILVENARISGENNFFATISSKLNYIFMAFFILSIINSFFPTIDTWIIAVLFISFISIEFILISLDRFQLYVNSKKSEFLLMKPIFTEEVENKIVLRKIQLPIFKSVLITKDYLFIPKSKIIEVYTFDNSHNSKFTLKGHPHKIKTIFTFKNYLVSRMISGPYSFWDMNNNFSFNTFDRDLLIDNKGIIDIYNLHAVNENLYFNSEQKVYFKPIDFTTRSSLLYEVQNNYLLNFRIFNNKIFCVLGAKEGFSNIIEIRKEQTGDLISFYQDKEVDQNDIYRSIIVQNNFIITFTNNKIHFFCYEPEISKLDVLELTNKKINGLAIIGEFMIFQSIELNKENSQLNSYLLNFYKLEKVLIKLQEIQLDHEIMIQVVENENLWLVDKANNTCYNINLLKIN